MKWLLLLIFAFPCFASLCDDVALVTVPKSGTHLLIKVVDLLCAKEGLSKPRFFHCDSYFESAEYQKNYPRIILLVRDPRDVSLSWVNYTLKGVEESVQGFPDKNISSLPIENKLTWKQLSSEKRLEYTIRGPSKRSYKQGIHPTLVYFPFQAFDPAIALTSRPHTLLCKFENLVGSAGGGTDAAQRAEIKKIAHFLGFDLSDDEICEMVPKLFGNTGTFHKGQIGGWKKAFTKDHKKLFKKRRQYLLEAFGYENDKNW